MKTELDLSTLYLASNSPRRKELLSLLKCDFLSVSAEIDESAYKGGAPNELVARLSHEKAIAAIAQNKILPAGYVIGGDTLIEFEGKVFGKPKDSADAKRMLMAFSGKRHNVLSAVSVAHNGMVKTLINETKVWFKELSEQEIAAYLQTDEAYDKAGAYAIQGEAAKWISRMDGSYYAVMGLPIFELNTLLEEFGFYSKQN